MPQRMFYGRVAPGAMKAMNGLESYIETTDIEPSLVHLVKLRASQINGCAYCVDMHAKDARSIGVSEEKVYMTMVWREAHCYSERERAAFLWTETLTLISENDVSDELYNEVHSHFTDKELVDLTLLVGLINAWNRFAIPFRNQPGQYQPEPQAVSAAS